jgi:hypothetical protein
MTEEQLIGLGFERVDVSSEESGENSYYYYAYELVNGFGLITPANDELENDKWFVEVFEFPDLKLREYDKLITFMNSIKQGNEI